MNLKPTKDRVLIEFVREDEVTKSGFIVPESARKRLNEGKVLAIGSTVKEAKVGDVVLFDTYAGQEFKIDGKDCLMFVEEFILAVKI